MSTLLTYQIGENSVVAFKKLLWDQGYLDRIGGEPSGMNLPRGILTHREKNCAQALYDAKQAAIRLGINLERCVAFSYEDANGIEGYEHERP